MNTSFIPAKTLGTLHNDPLCPHIECYITQLNEQGYTAKTIASHVHLFRRFQRWLKRRRCNLEELNERIVDVFLKNRKHDSHDGAPQAFRRLLGTLRASGVTPPAELPLRTPAQRIADEYCDYLRVQRSFAPKTVENYSRYVEGFLIDRFGDDHANLSRLKLCEVIGFVRRTARERNAIFAKGLIIALRSFLRYLFQHEKIQADWGAICAGNRSLASHWVAETTPKRNGGADLSRV